MRRRRDAQHARIAALEPIGLLANRSGIIQEPTAVLEQLRTFARQQQPASDSIEELECQFALEVGDLARQRGLGYVQLFGGPGNGAEVGYGDKRADFAKVQGDAPYDR